MSVLPPLTAIRGDWVPRLRLMSRVLAELDLRSAYVQEITAIKQSAPADASTALELERLCKTWMLVDNLLGVFAVSGHQLNLQTTRGRLDVARHIDDESIPPPRAFLKRVWLYESLREQIVREAIRPRGVTRSDYLARLDGLIERSVDAISRRYVLMRGFRDRYAAIAMAHRHGRAVFQLGVDANWETPVRITIRQSGNHLMAIRSPGKPGEPTQLCELTIDDIYFEEVSTVQGVVNADIMNYSALIGGLEAELPAFLEAVSSGRTGITVRERIPYVLLAAPYSEDELAVANSFIQGR